MKNHVHHLVLEVEKSGAVSTAWRFHHPQRVDFGVHSFAKIFLHDPKASNAPVAFDRKGSQFILRNPESIRIWLDIDENELSMGSLGKLGLLRKDRKGPYLPLSPASRGRLVFQNHIVHFHFEEGKPLLSGQKSPFHKRVGSGFSFLFTGMIAISALLHFLGYQFVMKNPIRHEITVKEMAKRYTRISTNQMDSMERQYREIQKRNPLPEKRRGTSRPDARSAGGFLKAVVSSTKKQNSGTSFQSLFTTKSITKDLDVLANQKDVMAVLSKRLQSGEVEIPTSSAESLSSPGKKEVRFQSGALEKSTSHVRVAQMSVQEASISGILDRQKLESLVHARSGQIQDCYETALLRRGQLSGKIVAEVRIGRGGVVEDFRFQENTVGDRGMENCIRERVARWPFPEPKGGTTTVRLPFIFAKTT